MPSDATATAGPTYFVAGLDLGQATDPTALAVVERSGPSWRPWRRLPEIRLRTSVLQPRFKRRGKKWKLSPLTKRR